MLACNRLRAAEYFIESINSVCPFEGYQCSDYQNFEISWINFIQSFIHVASRTSQWLVPDLFLFASDTSNIYVFPDPIKYSLCSSVICLYVIRSLALCERTYRIC